MQCKNHLLFFWVIKVFDVLDRTKETTQDWVIESSSDGFGTFGQNGWVQDFVG